MSTTPSNPVQSCQPTTEDRLRDAAVIKSSGFLPSRKLYTEAADEIASLRSQVSELRDALREISTHWANQYDHPRKENEMYRGSYGIGVTDGHRACKIIADKALAVNSQHSDGEAGR